MPFLCIQVLFRLDSPALRQQIKKPKGFSRQMPLLICYAHVRRLFLELCAQTTDFLHPMLHILTQRLISSVRLIIN